MLGSWLLGQTHVHWSTDGNLLHSLLFSGMLRSQIWESKKKNCWLWRNHVYLPWVGPQNSRKNWVTCGVRSLKLLLEIQVNVQQLSIESLILRNKSEPKHLHFTDSPWFTTVHLVTLKLQSQWKSDLCPVLALTNIAFGNLHTIYNGCTILGSCV